jgi:polysulfide reductase-like protein
VLLVADLGRPERFHHMLRVAKPTSPMSVGTWIITAFSPGAGVAAIDELVPRRFGRTLLGRLLHRFARPAGMSAALLAPGLASYTAVLLSHTAVPAWKEAGEVLPFVFTGSAAAASGGLGMVFTPVDEAAPARWFAICGATTELTASLRLENRLGLFGEAYTTGRAYRLRRWSELLTVFGLVGALVGRRNRTVAGVAGVALAGGSALQRFGVFAAGVASAKDPKYTVVPQRERLERGSPASAVHGFGGPVPE